MKTRRHLRRGMVWLASVTLLVTGGGIAAAYPRPAATTTILPGTRDLMVDLGPDARWVLLSSTEPRVGGDTNGIADLFLLDRATAVIERITVKTGGAQIEGSGTDLLLGGALSPDARYFAFAHKLSFVPEDDNATHDVYIRDRLAGTTSLVSAGQNGMALGSSRSPRLSADGRRVTFLRGSDLVIRDTALATTTVLPGANSTGMALTPDGRSIVSARLDAASVAQVFVRDLDSGTEEVVSRANDGTPGSRGSWPIGISADGRYIAFGSQAENLVPNNLPDVENVVFGNDLYVHDRTTHRTRLVTVNSNGQDDMGIPVGIGLSADGSTIAYTAFTNWPNPNSPNSIVLHHIPSGTTRAFTLNEQWAGLPQQMSDLRMTPDGRWVGFTGRNAPNSAIRLADLGPAGVGIGAFGTTQSGATLSVTGSVGLDGTVFAAASDPANDGTPGAALLGAELLGADLAIRPERQELWLRFEVTHLPEHGHEYAPAGAPAVSYVLRFQIGAVSWQIRAVEGAAGGVEVVACQNVTTCTRWSQPGGFGTTGEEVVVSVPFSVLGLNGSTPTSISLVRALTDFGDLTGTTSFDEVSLGSPVIPVPSVTARLEASDGGPIATAGLSIMNGAFSGSVDASSLAPGTHRLTTKLCLGAVCDEEERWVEIE